MTDRVLQLCVALTELHAAERLCWTAATVAGEAGFDGIAYEMRAHATAIDDTFDRLQRELLTAQAARAEGDEPR